ncbi:alternative ribosome rescue aminoacyl-tRNA hydrolase ArfB [Flagellimonas halotolerans]|uniref:Alternative ribosome rescue aminoacyl-tRNA hydrolase ArfB n=1 Tax=Flagellimonas halotolerans TaxID=3112164 RepID=A0ABU6IKW7_9FLAO|nr:MULTISPECIES: alternative ribosome rescue aminoacyl-tRNA hydrolase ArfB [unclassified Allomuricauda]MEC3963873.1 alternative ribosome rescue aminoacyl-tRNA hydrolase ArfB [Muricauda sp. SYSU M86414]MEC4263743.1 alternative ribosome rescue aminoacyl-tRNA hydrolase ArfB [Muricauda sp. SYSU M84420]
MDKKQIHRELQFKAMRSSGAGGQHVNKVSSKVELTFNIPASEGLSDREKQRIQLKLHSRLTNDGTLVLQCDEARSQHRNKDLVVKRFFELLKKALTIPKKRKPTKRTKSSIEKRLRSKKKTAEKKTTRKKPDLGK